MKNIFKDNYRFYAVLGTFILIIVLTFQTCNYRYQQSMNKKPFQKPFIVIDKQNATGPSRAEYTFQDKNGTTSTFFDLFIQFKVGDTLH